MRAAPQRVVRAQDFGTIDRRISLAFGVLMLGLMLTVLLASGWYLRAVIEREHNQLATITTQVMAKAVGYVNFSGKYQARLLLEELKQQHPNLVYARLLDAEARVLAHTNAQENDAYLGEDERAYIAPLLNGSSPLLERRMQQDGGRWVREISAEFRGGFGNQTQGVLQVAISGEPTEERLRSGVLYVASLLSLLLALGMVLTWRISRHFGMPVRQLAADMAHERQRLENVLQAMAAGTWEWNVQTNEVVLDERWAGIVGYQLSELAPITGQTFVQLCHPDDLAHSRQAIDAHFAGHAEHYACESRMRHKNGHWVWVFDSGRITERDAQGQPLKLIGARQDITQRKQAEEALRTVGERFAALARVSNTGVWEWDQQRQYLWCSPEYFSMLGRDVQHHLLDGSPNLQNTWVALLHPDDVQRASQKFADYLAAGAPGMYESEFRMQHANGSWVWIWSRGSALRDAQGHYSGKTMGTHINISAIKEAQARLDELNTHLEQRVQERTAELSAALQRLQHAQQELLQSEKLASLGALVAGVAHELNTPIGNAVTVASTLVQTHQRFAAVAQTGLTRSALAEYLRNVGEGGQIIERNLARAAELIGSFKQLAADQTSSQRRSFDLQEVVQEVTLAMRPALRKTPFALSETIAPGIALDSYPGPLGQVLMNLINNALIHAFEGRASGRIAISAQGDAPGWLRLSVTDDGCGMAPEQQKKIFDPFFTTKLGQGGSGLGLHITHTLVTGLLGGRIEVQSQLGQGSSFVVYLPLIAPDKK